MFSTKTTNITFKKFECYCLNMHFPNRNVMKIQEEFGQGSKKLKKDV